MARTFDLSDPDQKRAYLEEAAVQWALYRSVSIGFGRESGLITLYDGAELDTAPGGRGFVTS